MLGKKNQRGAKRKTASALIRQSIEPTVVPKRLIEESDESDVEEDIQPDPITAKRRGRPKSNPNNINKKSRLN